METVETRGIDKVATENTETPPSSLKRPHCYDIASSDGIFI